jgi:Flp pilus assembly protein TadB
MDDNTETPEQADEREEGKSIQSNVKARSTWLRLFFVLVVIALYWVCAVVIAAVVTLQCFWLLFTRESNEKLRRLGQNLATYIYQAVRYVTFDTEERPFPFDMDFPSEPPAV